MKCSVNRCRSLFASLSICLFLVVFQAWGRAAVEESSEGIRVQGPGVPLHIGFACCERGVEQMQSLFARPGLIGFLRDLHATVAIPTLDFSRQRADIVRLLNQQGVPVVGWIILSSDQGSYLAAANAPPNATQPPVDSTPP